MDTRDTQSGYLTGSLLVAMPAIGDPRFEKSVIYLCAHSEGGAMGIVVNKVLGALTVSELMSQLSLEGSAATERMPVHFGGPVETGRGFVLHSSDHVYEGTLQIDERMALTATMDVLKAIAAGEGPKRALMALGYAGWGPGQLDQEIQANGWLQVPADEDLVFGTSLDEIWDRALKRLGIDLTTLSSEAGHA
ncbi:YqgE/AlgH family protein [Stella sp.]|uniref:YqgE/AlgH family protein n=1 Tax=Stella sp. TaxID=2912054 RepID=UPI0035AFF427